MLLERQGLLWKTSRFQVIIQSIMLQSVKCTDNKAAKWWKLYVKWKDWCSVIFSRSDYMCYNYFLMESWMIWLFGEGLWRLEHRLSWCFSEKNHYKTKKIIKSSTMEKPIKSYCKSYCFFLNQRTPSRFGELQPIYSFTTDRYVISCWDTWTTMKHKEFIEEHTFLKR